jgi:hypothetical protein
MAFGIDDHDKSVPRREDQKVEPKLSESGRTFGVSERETGRLEERVAALESIVTFLMSRISEDRRPPIKSELER